MLHLTCWSCRPLLRAAIVPPSPQLLALALRPAQPFLTAYPVTLQQDELLETSSTFCRCVGFFPWISLSRREKVGCPFSHCLQFLRVVAAPLWGCCEAVCGAALWTGSLKISGLEKNVPVFSQPAPPPPRSVIWLMLPSQGSRAGTKEGVASEETV